MLSTIDSALPQLGNAESKVSFRRVAFFISLSFVAVTIVAAIWGNVPGPHARAFLPICATIWAMAELLTAFFLCTQFYVAGKISYAFIAVGYASTGLLTVPYLWAFPGVVSPLSLGALQVSVWLWVIWHITFPVVIGVTHLIDPTLEQRVVAREKIGIMLVSLLAGTGACAIGVAAIVWSARDHLVQIIYANGHFTHEYTLFVAPVVVLANLAGCAVVSRRLREAKALHLWIAVALLTSALDGVVNATSPARYTISWYVGKMEALTTASVVLLMLLFEVSTLYRRLFDLASVDPLTGLHNRRTLDSEIKELVNSLPRMEHGLAVLMLDLDKFKTFNDTYGHAQGDAVLRTVAGVLRKTVRRPNDHLARYGGEEFIAVLADTTLDGALRVAERIRAAIAAAPIVLADGSLRAITTSIGIAFASSRAATTDANLIERADRALYEAKRRGRNCVVVNDELAFARHDTHAFI